MIPPIVCVASLASQGLLEINESHNRGGYRGLLATEKYRNRQEMRVAGFIKTNPLPVGRYWIDIFKNGLPSWIGWSGGNLATVNIEKTEVYQGTTKLFEVLGWIYPWVPTPANPDKTVMPDRAFIIFNITAPTNWDISDKVGWPSTAPKGVIETSDDTVQKPDPNDILPEWPRSPEFKFAVAGLGVLGVAVLAGYAVRSFK